MTKSRIIKPTTKEIEELFGRIRGLEESLALLEKVKEVKVDPSPVEPPPTKIKRSRKPKERLIPPVVYAFGIGIKAVCPICNRTVMVGVCPETEKKIKKGNVPTEVELPCGDRVPLIISR